MVQAQRVRPARNMLLAGVIGGLALIVVACGSTAPSTPSPTGSGAASASAASSASSSRSSAAPTTARTTTANSAGSSPGLSTAASQPVTGSAGVGGTETKLTGTINEGVESGCLVLTDPSGAVLANLIGVDKSTAPIGSVVDVTGKFQADLMTTCQQGVPFEVAVIEPR